MVHSFVVGIGIPKGIPAAATMFSSNTVKAAFSLELLVSAVYEEIVSRVYLQSKLQKLLGGRIALSIFISAGLFAIVHGYTVRGTIAVLATGILFGAVYQASRSVPRLVLAHWIHNLIVYYVP
jgi:membrane protease YdiL (CAAX protease family)